MSLVYRFLMHRRWVSLFLVALAAIPLCITAARWQLDRLHLRQEQNAQIHRNAEAAPRPVWELTSVGGTVAKADEWRAVRLTGRYDEEHQLFVRNRPGDGKAGFHVLTPLVLVGGPAVLVNRGWVAATPARATPDLPDLPEGEVTVTGRLRPTETQDTRGPRDAADVPAGQVVRLDVPRIAAALPYSVYAGFVQLATQDPAPPVVDGFWVPRPLGLPSRSEALHWSYAAQWFVFAGVIPVGVFLLIRREILDRRRGIRTPASRQDGAPPVRAG
jgi:cytochrome oxidase assembly protein ShyY1